MATRATDIGTHPTATAAAASLTADALTIFQPIVSHTTDTFERAQSIVRDGIDLNRNRGWNLFGKAFYVAEKGYSIHEVEGNYTVTFKVSKKIKILDAVKQSEQNGEYNPKKLASMAKDKGFDAIKDEGGYRKRNGKFNYNLAIIRNPEYLTPTGVYPVPSDFGRRSAISIPTIRILQSLGAAGATYAVYIAGKKIINSKQPIVETAHQTCLLGTAVLGGKAAGVSTIVPCGLVGAAFPPLAPYTVPICIASASVLGGAIAATITDIAWNSSVTQAQAAEQPSPVSVPASPGGSAAMSIPGARVTRSASVAPRLDEGRQSASAIPSMGTPAGVVTHISTTSDIDVLNGSTTKNASSLGGLFAASITQSTSTPSRASQINPIQPKESRTMTTTSKQIQSEIAQLAKDKEKLSQEAISIREKLNKGVWDPKESAHLLNRKAEILRGVQSMDEELLQLNHRAERSTAVSVPPSSSEATAEGVKSSESRIVLQPILRPGQVAVREADMERFLHNSGVSPASVSQAIQNSELMTIAREQLSILQRQDEELRLQKTQQEYLSAFQGGERAFNVLSAVGARLESRAIIVAGKAGALSMKAAGAYEKLTGHFSGIAGASSALSMLDPIATFLEMGVGIVDLILRTDSEPDAAQQLGEMLVTISQQMTELRTEMREEFTQVKGALTQLAGMSQAILANQQQLYKLQHATYDLIGNCFKMMSTSLHDLRSENKAYYERMYSDIRYLVQSAEIKEIKEYRGRIKRKVDAITDLDKLESASTSEKQLRIVELFSNLKSYIEELCSASWNGSVEYSTIKDNPEQSNLYFSGRFQAGDYALGPLADEFEKITNTQLSIFGIDKKTLFANSLWEQAVSGYLTLSKLPSLKDYDCRTTLTTIEKQAENAIKFMQQIGQSEILFKQLLERHQQYCHEFQFLLLQVVAGKSYKGTPGSRERLDILDFYFSDCAERVAINKLGSKIDNNLLLVKQFAKLGGLNSDALRQIDTLSSSAALLGQAFNFTDSPNFDGMAGHLSHGYYDSDRHDPETQQFYTGFETVGGKLIKTKDSQEIMHLTISNHTHLGQAAGRVLICLGQYDIKSHKPSSGSSFDSATSGIPPIPSDYKKSLSHRLLGYDDRASYDVRHAWSSTHIWTPHHRPSWFGAAQPHFIFMTGGHVAMYDVTNNKWLECNNSNNPASFKVPLPRSGKANVPKTYNAVIVQDKLIVNLFDWQSSPDNVTLSFHAFSLLKQNWLQPSEDILCPFPGKPLTIPKCRIKSPNQVFVQNLNNDRFKTDPNYIVGILSPNTKWELVIIRKNLPNPIYNGKAWYSTHYKKAWEILKITRYEITAKEVNQLKSEILMIDGVKHLIIAASIKVTDTTNKLMLFKGNVANLNDNFDVCEYILPPVNKIADLQAMQVAPFKMGNREYLIVTLLSHDFRFLVFCFDPHTNNVVKLPDGPIAFKEAPRFSSAQHLNPGFYPISSLSMNIAYEENMAILYFTFPKLEGTREEPRWKIQIIPYKLAPLLKASFDANTLRIPTLPVISVAATQTPALLTSGTGTPSPVPVADTAPPTAIAHSIQPPANLLSLSILRIQLLAQEQKLRLEQQIQTRAFAVSIPALGERKVSREESQILLELRSELVKRDEQVDTLKDQLRLLAEQQAKTNSMLERMLGMAAVTPAFTPMFGMQTPVQERTSQTRSSAVPSVGARSDMSGEQEFKRP